MRKSHDSKKININLDHFLSKTTKTPFMPIKIKSSRKFSTSQNPMNPEQDTIVEYEIKRKLIN